MISSFITTRDRFIPICRWEEEIKACNHLLSPPRLPESHSEINNNKRGRRVAAPPACVLVELNHDKIWQESRLRGIFQSCHRKKPSWTRYCLADFMHMQTSVTGGFKGPANFFFFWQKLSIKHEHLDKLDHKQNSARGSGKIKWMLQVSVGGLGSFCRCKYNSNVNVDHKLYIL